MERHAAGSHSAAGRPAYQHDRAIIHHTQAVSLYAVADGHGNATTGHTVSEHIAAHLPSLLLHHGLLSPTACATETATRFRTAITALDASAIAATSARRIYAGSTLCAVLRVGDSLVCANVGDSRAVVVCASGAPRALSRDHVCTLPAEKARIERAGGVVLGGLLNGYISMSRAIGDDDLKSHRNLTPFPVHPGGSFDGSLFVADADVLVDRVRDADLVTVVASDGVWGRLSNTDVATVVRGEIRRGRSADEMAHAVVKKAIAKGSKDNVTAVVAFLTDEKTMRKRVGATDKLTRRGWKGPSTPTSVMVGFEEMSRDDERTLSSSFTSSGHERGDTKVRSNRMGWGIRRGRIRSQMH